MGPIDRGLEVAKRCLDVYRPLCSCLLEYVIGSHFSLLVKSIHSCCYRFVDIVWQYRFLVSRSPHASFI